MRGSFRGLALAIGLLVAALAPTSAAAATGLPAIRHVFVIVEENEGASTTFGPSSPAPYLSKTLRAQGAYVPNYYGIGHQSNDNYIAMISGQAPNPDNQADCLPGFDNFMPDVIGSYGQAMGTGCVFPTDVETIADQLSTAGWTWRDYNDSMGADPSREAAECGHPGVGMPDNTQSATATDQYATRHNPFVYFHSIIDDTALCDSHVVNLDMLPQDLASAASTPNYVFITPSLCNDAHDSPCANGQPGGLQQADSFLQTWVPKIMGSPAFKADNGLLAIIFDEASTSDTSSCCGEIAGPNSPSPGVNGPGGGVTGAVLLSPCIKPGTVTSQPYNHYTLLRSIEDLFGLSHLGYAQLPGEQSLGTDVFNRACGQAPAVRLHAPALASSVATGPRVRVSWSAAAAQVQSFAVQVQRTSAGGHGWRTLLGATARRSLLFRGRTGATYRFRVRATSGAGLTSDWATATTVLPTAARVSGARYRGSWRLARVRNAWERHALIGSGPGSSLSLSYTGGTLQIVGDAWPRGGRARVTLDGRSRTISLHSARPHARRVLYRAQRRLGRHRLVVRALRGAVAIEGLAITARRR